MITPHSVPRLAASVRLRFDRIEGRAILLGPERGFLLNATAQAIIELCTGEHRVAEIAARLQRGSRAELATVERDVIAFLSDLERCRFVCAERAEPAEPAP